MSDKLEQDIRRLEDEVAYWKRQWGIVYEDAEFLRAQVRELLRKQDDNMHQNVRKTSINVPEKEGLNTLKSAEKGV